MGWNESESEDTRTYRVVMNDEEQHSIWLDYKQLPNGWKDGGKAGSKAECLAYIKEVWTDMRPLSLRKKMEEDAKTPPPPPPLYDPAAPREKTIVERLCEGEHSVEVGLRPEKSAKVFKEAIDQGYVHMKFTATKGGTEIGVRLNRNSSDFSGADFENGKGNAHVEGNLTLDYVKVKCIADVDLNTLKGKGHLVKVEAADL
jgi:uncharacterized protein YbdZ (MbtH family)